MFINSIFNRLTKTDKLNHGLKFEKNMLMFSFHNSATVFTELWAKNRFGEIYGV